MFSGPAVYSEDLKHKNPHDTIAIYWAQLCYRKLKGNIREKHCLFQKII